MNKITTIGLTGLAFLGSVKLLSLIGYKPRYKVITPETLRLLHQKKVNNGRC